MRSRSVGLAFCTLLRKCCQSATATGNFSGALSASFSSDYDGFDGSKCGATLSCQRASQLLFISVVPVGSGDGFSSIAGSASSVVLFIESASTLVITAEGNGKSI